MNRTVTLAAITLVSALAAPVVVHATTARSSAVSAPVEVAAAPKADEPTCTRQVRVVYAGYGEGQTAPCTGIAR